MSSLSKKIIFILLISTALYYSFTYLAVFSKANPYRKTSARPQIAFRPKQYLCLKTTQKIRLDGKLDEKIWQTTPFSEFFVDTKTGKISHTTHLKMLWDEQYCYLALVSDKTKKPTISLFLDYKNNATDYLQISLENEKVIQKLFNKTPQNGGEADQQWLGEQVFVKIHTNKTQQTWEIKIPIPKNRPIFQKYWRFNVQQAQFSWSPQGIDDMHFPEMWGFVYFDEKKIPLPHFYQSPDEQSKWQLREVFYAQNAFYLENNKFTSRKSELHLPIETQKQGIIIEATQHLFEARLKSSTGKTWAISQEGKVWHINP